MGEPLGCKDCYTTFQDVLTKELLESNLISARLTLSPNNSILHIGKSPDNNASTQSGNRIRDLNESLSEALKGENYEEAAWLRDQINALTEAKDERI